MISLIKIAQPYAKAIFQISKKKKNIKLWKKMLLFCIHIIKNKNFKIIFKNNYNNNNIYKLLINICKLYTTKKFINLIKIIQINKRLNILNIILNELINLENIYKKNNLINIIVAYEINNLQKQKIKFFFKKKKKNCIFKFIKNPKIIGGIIIKINNIIYNYSILEFLKNF